MSSDSVSGVQPPANAQAFEGLLPLPLVPFERYFLSDDRHAYPMNFRLRMNFAGTPDRQRLAAAWKSGLARHPLLSARLQQGSWHPSDNIIPPIWEGPEGHSAPEHPFDLQEAPGAQLHVLPGPEGATLDFRFHHAVCDAVGALQFAGDVLAFYHAASIGRANHEMLEPLDAQLLRQRQAFDITLPGQVSAGQVLLTTLKEGWRILSCWPIQLTGRKVQPATPPLFLEHATDPELYTRLQQRAAESDVTTNDLMLRDLFLTIAAWNRTRGKLRARSWIRVIMPISLRGPRDVAMPATNLLGYALVGRRVSDCDNSDRLLSSLTAETRLIKDWALGAVFVNAITLLDRVPGMLSLMTGFCRQFTTVIYSNLGNPEHRLSAELPERDGRLRAGDLELRSFSGAPPVRPGTRLAMMLTQYGGRLVLGAHVDGRWFGRELGEQFLRLYEAQLQATAAASPPSASASAAPGP